MAESLRILILEDRPVDAELVQFELREAGMAFISRVVMTEQEYLQALQDFSPDLILSDYDLPRYNGALALAEARKRCPNTPFILVTGAVGEDRAIEILTQGAKDYVLKSRLEQRLVPAVRRALAEAEERGARRKAEEELREAHRTLEERVETRTAELQAEIAARKKMEEALRESEERFRSLFQSVPSVAVQSYGPDGVTQYWNRASEHLYGYPAQEAIGRNLRDLIIPPELHGDFSRDVRMMAETGQPIPAAEMSLMRKDGSSVAVFSSHAIVQIPGRAPELLCVAIDITDRKRAEQEMTILAEIGRAIGSTLEIDEVYERVAAEIRKLIPFDSLIVNLSDPPQEMLYVAYVAGLDIPGRRAGQSFPVRGTIAEKVIRTRRGAFVQSEHPAPLLDEFPSLIVSVQAGMRSIMCVPLISRDEAIGSLIMRSRKPGAYTEQDLRLAEKIGMQIAGAIANAQLFSDLSKTERSLRESEERLRSVIDHTQAGYFFIDRAGFYQRVNSAWLRMHGYDSADEVIGRHFSLTQPEMDMEAARQQAQVAGRRDCLFTGSGINYVLLLTCRSRQCA